MNSATKLESVLRSTPEFKQSTNDEVQILDRIFTISNFPDGHVFFKNGSTGKASYLILDGTISVRRYRGGAVGSLEIKRHGRGEWFGIISLLSNVKHQATCTAVGEVTVASLPQAAFLLLYNSHTHLAHQIQMQIARQLIRDHRQLLTVVKNVVNDIEAGTCNDVVGAIQSGYNNPQLTMNEVVMPS